MNIHLFIQVKLHLKTNYLSPKKKKQPKPPAPKPNNLFLILAELKADSLFAVLAVFWIKQLNRTASLGPASSTCDVLNYKGRVFKSSQSSAMWVHGRSS